MLPKTLKIAVLWSLATLLVFLLAEAALFRSGWYFKDLEPDSSAGLVEYPLYWLRRSTVAKNAPANQHEIIVVGDSRVAEGFSTQQASEVTGGQTRFWNFGVPG